ncbi:MAG: hypothetical protein COZ06_03130 [Armatimonadetes bacterium CG_4_10_14_3_um_filter_66_18]|nr:Gfo/Idh/MocA family oxidoreductase [Armatimonadota bacterium]OIP09566.1 MAG: hypothetical protein AUJ96_05020 [Armatimonadetes bacterium CG2_30_66_41]PIU89011.1 MAG: hypothetical protein COS65_29515 [Armatimonadetes bacterium CG06_land_8_20_14_3_00_66_21]PIX37089.1 MAG: hypothetical protein COZ57_36080 [Armatimonadetes bacterium CG_4_8_14_3_um_filter_66_20]PIY52298.1 MAG: hypothetical protein COZ06_03130 [Armatimonadetes bacterium CG_4_10_14_3_um_filter_66_18]PIZ34829.1 MAG: hypothetical pr
MKIELRLGLVGCGGRGRGMFKLATGGFAGVQPVAVCDLSPDLASAAAAEHPGADQFTDFEAMLDGAALDALLVETPANVHAKLCAQALRRNVYVMGDVPCVDSPAEAQQLWDAQQESDAFYMLGANPNMWAFVETAVDLKEKGLLGEPYYAETEYIHDVQSLFTATPWRETYESIKYCTHSLGPIMRLIDEDLEWVSCFDTGSHVNKKPGQHDAMAALFRTRSNVAVRLLTSFVNHYPGCNHHYRVYGTKGYFERTPAYNGAPKVLFRSTELYLDKAFVELPIDTLRPEYVGNARAAGHGGADYALLDRFFGAVRTGGPAPIGVRDALRMSLPGVLAAESARRGGELLRIAYPWTATDCTAR